MTELPGRHFLTLADFSRDELLHLLELAAELKAAKRDGREERRLEGKTIALLFEKDSTRTRSAFEVAAYDQGAHVTYIGATGSHTSQKESLKDTARVLGRMYDAIGYRGFDEHLDELAAWAGVPVFNALTEQWHPTQILADFMTIQEHVAKPLEDVAFCYLGDARFNMANSYLVGGARLGMDVRIAAPAITPAVARARRSRAREQPAASRSPTTSPRRSAAATSSSRTSGSRWASRDDVWAERIELLLPYQVNAETMALTGNADVKFMHCLPAFHDTRTKVGREVYEKFGLDAMEVTDEVFESAASLVWDEAENRMHTIKALLVSTLAT